MVGVDLASIKYKMREKRLRLFGHVYRQSVNAIVRKSDVVLVEGNTNGKGRP